MKDPAVKEQTEQSGTNVQTRTSDFRSNCRRATRIGSNMPTPIKSNFRAGSFQGGLDQWIDNSTKKEYECHKKYKKISQLIWILQKSRKRSQKPIHDDCRVCSAVRSGIPPSVFILRFSAIHSSIGTVVS